MRAFAMQWICQPTEKDRSNLLPILGPHRPGRDKRSGIYSQVFSLFEKPSIYIYLTGKGSCISFPKRSIKLGFYASIPYNMPSGSYTVEIRWIFSLSNK